MVSRYRWLAVYSVSLAGVAGWWLATKLADVPDFPSLPVVLLCVAACLFVWQFGVPAPRIGLTSMERLPQIGLLLIFGAPVAAALCAMGSFLLPFLNRAYSQGSLKVAALRAVHNPAMTVLMLLLAGEVYVAFGGRYPLEKLQSHDLLPLAAMALMAQAVNVLLMALFYRLDGRNVRRIMTPSYALIDLLFVPAGVLAAILYNSAPLATFLLFAALMIVFVVSFHGLGRTMAEDARSEPLLRLRQTRRALHGARRMDDLGTRILTEIRALFRFDEFHLVLLDTDQQVLDVRVHERAGERLATHSLSIEEGLFGLVMQTGQPLLIENWGRAPAAARERAAAFRAAGSIILVPLVEEGRIIGLVSLQHAQPGIYSDADLNVMQQLAEQLAQAVADARAFEELERYRSHLEERVAERTRQLEEANRDKERLIAALGERSRTLERESQEDPLTAIANRRAFTQRLSAELDLARTLNRPLAVAVADLDHFKVVNDGLGHAVGDEVLRQAAALMRRMCRATDMVARIGGEEFAFILPGIPQEAALLFCESVRRAVESHNWQAVHPGLRVTLSIGIAQWNGTGDIATLLEAADHQLYSAKHAGRNRVA